MSVFNKNYWLNKGYSEEEAIYQINIRRPSNINYWLNKGYNEEEAKIKLKTFQSNNNKNKTKEDYRKNSKRCIEYWLSKGYNEEEAKKEISKIQNTFSLEKCINKYGEKKGYEIWLKRQKKWQNTLNSKSEKEKNIINKKKNVLNLSYLRKKFNNDIDIKEYVLKHRNINLILSIENFDEYLKLCLLNNPDLFYSTPEKICKKIPKIQFDILNIKNKEDFIKKYLSQDKDVIYKSNSRQSYRKWIGNKLLRSSYEIQFYNMLKEKNIEFEIDNNYPDSSFRYDFYIKKYNHYIEIAPLYNKDIKYKEKMDKKTKIFGCIILTNYKDFLSYLESI